MADSRGRHWLPKREGAHEVGRTASGYLPLQHSYQPALIPISLHWFLKVRTGIIVSQPCNPGSRALARPTAKRHMPPLQSQPLSPHHSLQAATRKSSSPPLPVTHHSPQPENHLPFAPAFCGFLRGIMLAGAGILNEPARRNSLSAMCRAHCHGRCFSTNGVFRPMVIFDQW